MENLTAAFTNWEEMNQAATALREQGAIDIRVAPAGREDINQAESMMPSLTSLSEETASGFILQVVVESSRFRQAEDTIANFGGIST